MGAAELATAVAPPTAGAEPLRGPRRPEPPLPHKTQPRTWAQRKAPALTARGPAVVRQTSQIRGTLPDIPAVGFIPASAGNIFQGLRSGPNIPWPWFFPQTQAGAPCTGALAFIAHTRNLATHPLQQSCRKNNGHPYRGDWVATANRTIYQNPSTTGAARQGMASLGG